MEAEERWLTGEQVIEDLATAGEDDVVFKNAQKQEGNSCQLLSKFSTAYHTGEESAELIEKCTKFIQSYCHLQEVEQTKTLQDLRDQIDRLISDLRTQVTASSNND